MALPDTPQGGKSSREAGEALGANRVFQLVASGLTVPEAADRLGMSSSHADRLYHRALEAVRSFDATAKQERIATHLETLRLLHRAHMPRALGGSIGSAQVVLGCLDRESKLMGYDEAIRVEVSTAAVTDTVRTIVEMVDAEVPLGPPPDLPELPAFTATPAAAVEAEQHEPLAG